MTVFLVLTLFEANLLVSLTIFCFIYRWNENSMKKKRKICHGILYHHDKKVLVYSKHQWSFQVLQFQIHGLIGSAFVLFSKVEYLKTVRTNYSIYIRPGIFMNFKVTKSVLPVELTCSFKFSGSILNFLQFNFTIQLSS